jgi:multidrug efflux pump
MIGGAVISMVVFALIAGGMAFLFSRMATGFLPDEDQGLLFGQITLPPGSTAEQTAAVNTRVTDYLLKSEKQNVASALSVVGFNFAGQAQNAGFFAISLTPWDKRPLASQSATAISRRAIQHFAHDRDAQIFVVSPPAVIELGNATGFDMELIDRANLGHAALTQARGQLLGMAAQNPNLAQVRPNGLDDTSQYKLQIDRQKLNASGVSIGDLNTLIEGAFGSVYVNQFQRNGRVKQVYVQGDAASRMLPDQLGEWYLRNANGGMVPLSTVMTGKWEVGPAKVESYNGDTSMEILGAPAPGQSTGQASAIIAKLASKLPHGIGYEWTGLSYEEAQAGSQTTILYSFSGVVILFCLAALYESWAIPLAVMLVIPLGVIGAVLATLLRGLDNDVYFQVGLLTTTGLAVKNAILIVEFAKANYEAGESLRDAALHAAQERLRPILMTSLAFIFGVFPLAIASGAGAASRTAIGTAVVGGMATATVLAVFFVPVFFTTVLGLFRIKPRAAGAPESNTPDGGTPREAGA